MFSERYGVNTTKAALEILLILVAAAALGCLGACGGGSDSGAIVRDTIVAASADNELSEEKVIEETLNEVITRLRYGDKSGLYENEFEYLLDELTFDDYLKKGEIAYAQADTITFVEVRHVTFFDRDSAAVDVTVHFEGATGKKSYHRDKIMVYYHMGRWIKPTVSIIDLQVEYAGKIRVADSAAAADALEGDLN